MNRLAIAALAALTVSLAACATTPATTSVATPAATTVTTPAGNYWGHASTLLNVGMAEDDVRAAIGEPSRVAMLTCGTQAGLHPWQCKQVIYEHRAPGASTTDMLALLFQQSHDRWLLNSWNEY
jgi:hypothetical protein